MKGTISMSEQEVDRVGVMQRLAAKEIKQRHAAKLLQISVRQIKRIFKSYKFYGAIGLVHKGRGQKGNRALPKEEKDRMLHIIKTNYADFGPTLACEKLAEIHGVHHADETVRKLMIAEGLWTSKRRKIVNLHQMRERRSCEGELVQLDGSPHDWFEGRGPSCTLLVYIDDATGKLKHLQFVVSESTHAYFVATREYLILHGKPLAFYLDKHGVFRVNTTKAHTAAVDDSNGVTQFGRAMQELAIALIFAETPQAKGRVERVNQTLQDRLVKEMRLRGIMTMEQGNQYLPEFMAEFNRKFAVCPKEKANVHRPLLSHENLDRILCEQHKRILSKQLTLSYQNRIYQIKTDRQTYAMRHAPVVVRKDQENEITIEYKGGQLEYEILIQQPKAEIIDSKHINSTVDRLVKQQKAVTKTHRPKADHVWRRAGHLAITLAKQRHGRENQVTVVTDTGSTGMNPIMGVV